MKDKLYLGKIGPKGDRYVLGSDDTPFDWLLPHHTVLPHGPEEPFDWGRISLGTMELSLSLLFDATNGDVRLCRGCYMDYAYEVLQRLPTEREFVLTQREILADVQRLQERWPRCETSG